MAQFVVLDNGGGQLKFGMAGQKEPHGNIPNCTARVEKDVQVFVADEIDTVYNGATLHYTRPFDKGFLTNWQCELEVWQRVFGSPHLNINPSNSYLTVTEAPFTPEALQNDMNEVVFEDFGFKGYVRRPAAWFSAYEFSSNPPPNISFPSSCLVVDSGFSFSHIMPFIQLKCVKPACKRVNIGGKLLTNYLKEIVSFRQFNMMDEFRLMNQIKESMCFVSPDIQSYLKRLRVSGRTPDDVGVFVLPDYQKVMVGYALDTAAKERMMKVGLQDSELQVMALDVERPGIGEVLFNPHDSNIGSGQAGLVDAAWQCLSQLSMVEMGLTAANVILTGGNAHFPGFKERFRNDLRPLVPDVIDMSVHLPDNPSEVAWRGASRFTSNFDLYRKSCVTKEMYTEHGHWRCNNVLSDW